MATTPPPAVAEALADLAEWASWLPHGGQKKFEASLALIAAHLHSGAGPGGERDALLREALSWKPHHEYEHDRERDEKTCPLCQWRVRVRALLPPPPPATEAR